MKKLSILSVALSVAVFTGVATAQIDGTVKFRGKVVEQTCAVGTGFSQKVLTVSLPTINKTALDGAKGSVAGLTAFDINLQGCTTSGNKGGVSKVKVHFLPKLDNVDVSTGTLKNIAKTSPASNVNVQLLGKDQQAIVVGKHVENDPNAKDIADQLTFTYFAQYYATDTTVTAGTVESTAEFNIAYE